MCIRDRVKEGKVEAITGEDVEIRADSICVHGDNPEAVGFVEVIRKTLESQNVQVLSIKDFIK